MAAKATFDATTRIITLTETPVLENGDLVVDIDVKVDLYSDGKEDWIADESLRKVAFPLSAVGGNPTVGSNKLGSTFFLASDWKIAPFEASHRLRINGNFYSVDGTSPFNTTSGSYNIFLEQTVSNLTDSTIQQLAEIEQASFGGCVTVDVLSTYSGVTYPIGTPQAPVNNIPDAVSIATARGLIKICIIGNITLDTGDILDSFVISGQSPDHSTVTVNPGASTVDTQFQNCTLEGTLDGGSLASSCHINNLNFVDGSFHDCQFDGTITLSGLNTFGAIRCFSGVPGASTPVIDLGGSGTDVYIRDYQGGLELQNKTGTDPVSIDMSSGNLIVDSTVTAGTIIVRGIAGLTDNSTGTAVVDSSKLLSAQVDVAIALSA